ncbi:MULTISPECIES: hypothetical protein [unclassified Kribbella]|uniref:hypothetical protein n=1 Tax=unclassified Kribbella TaxID=2644121 RepID=UPI00301A9B73
MPSASTGLIFGRTPAIADVLSLTRAAEAGTALCGIAGLTPEGVRSCRRPDWTSPRGQFPTRRPWNGQSSWPSTASPPTTPTS